MRLRAAILALAWAACQHAKPPPPPPPPAPVAPPEPPEPPEPDPPPPPPRPDYAALARDISEQARALFTGEADLLWRRWTTGTGPLPVTASANRGKLFAIEPLRAVAIAADEAQDERDALALRLLHGQLAARAIALEASAEAEELERARSLLTFTPAGAARPERERDLDRLLLDEPAPARRAAIAQAEAHAAAQLAPLVKKRDEAFIDVVEELELPAWPRLVEELHRLPPSRLAALAEETLRETAEVARRAVAEISMKNLGLPADRLNRADLPRLLRVTGADPEFPPGGGHEHSRKLLAGAGVDAATLDGIRLDAEPRPAKGARPLALLVDPPRDVRLSYRGTGGFEEMRGLLHEAARAAGGALTDPQQRWELSQLGDGTGAEGVARLFEGLVGDPLWLRESTRLRGEPLDEIVHTQATRRLLAARRSAALVLFEVRRRKGAPDPAALYRGLLQEATFALHTEDDARRWPLEADAWIRHAAGLQGEILAATLEIALRREAGDRSGAAGFFDEEEEGEPKPVVQPSGPPWWRAEQTPPLLKRIWSLGRSASAENALRAAKLDALDPELLAAVADERLGYRSPERPPEPPRPDYRELRDDRRRRWRKKRVKKKRPVQPAK